jgi:hypothetical protein
MNEEDFTLTVRHARAVEGTPTTDKESKERHHGTVPFGMGIFRVIYAFFKFGHNATKVGDIFRNYSPNSTVFIVYIQYSTVVVLQCVVALRL